MHAVLEPDAELAVDRDGWLVAEAHAGLDARGITAHEVRPLVPIQSDAVARAVGQARHFVVRAESRGRNDLACRGIY